MSPFKPGNRLGFVNGRTTIGAGYIGIHMPSHPRAHCAGGYVLEHVLVAERALGKALPEGAVVHHVNENKADNRPSNLVICEDHAYHMGLHRRMDAMRASGHADWLKCRFCARYDAPEFMYINPANGSAHHRACEQSYARRRRAERPAEYAISRSQAAEIRSRYAAGGISQAALGREFGISQTYVGLIVRGARRAT